MPHCQNTSQVQQRRVCVISSRVVIHLTGEMCFTGILEGISLDYLKIGQEWQKRNCYNFIKSFVKKKIHTTYLSYFKMDARVNLGGYTEYQAENKEGCERSHHFWLALSSSWALRSFSSAEKVSLVKHWQFSFFKTVIVLLRETIWIPQSCKKTLLYFEFFFVFRRPWEDLSALGHLLSPIYRQLVSTHSVTEETSKSDQDIFVSPISPFSES